MTVSTSSLPMRHGLRELGKIENSLNFNPVPLRVTYRHSFMMKPNSLAYRLGKKSSVEGCDGCSFRFREQLHNVQYELRMGRSLSTTTIIFQRSKMDHRHRRQSRSSSRRIYPSHSDSYRPSDQSRSSPRRRPNCPLRSNHSQQSSQMQSFA
jgi:hypothetical protein